MITSSFDESAGDHFTESTPFARGQGSSSLFGFQILNSIRQACDDNFAPVGWPTGIYLGPNGPYVPWQDFTFLDPRGADFLVPTAAQLNSDGWIHETWVSNNKPLISLDPFFGRIGTTDHTRLFRSGSPVGFFNSETVASGFKVRKGALVLNQGFTYDDVTSTYDVFFPGGISHDQIQRLKLYDMMRGTITKHTIPNTALFTQAANFSNVLPAPTHIEEYAPARGDAPKIFQPNEFVYGLHHLTATGVGNSITAGTIEILVFWFNLTPGQLPAFPLNINTATDFFFVG